jgi:hypothetical protein
MTSAEFREMIAPKHRTTRITPNGFKREKELKSYAEKLWRDEGPGILLAATKSRIVRMIYEPFVLELPGGRRYKIDWIALSEDYQFHLVATKGKGSHKLAGYRDSRAALKECVELHDWARYWQADRVDKTWKLTEIVLEKV